MIMYFTISPLGRRPAAPLTGDVETTPPFRTFIRHRIVSSSPVVPAEAASGPMGTVRTSVRRCRGGRRPRPLSINPIDKVGNTSQPGVVSRDVPLTVRLHVDLRLQASA